MAGKLKSFVDVIGLWPSVMEMANDLHVSYDLVRRWQDRDSIPAWFWQDILKHAGRRKLKVTADDLVKIAGR